MATLKHIASKNSDYTAIEAYLVYQHDEFSGKVILDEQGKPLLRESYILDPFLHKVLGVCADGAEREMEHHLSFGCAHGRQEDLIPYHSANRPPACMICYRSLAGSVIFRS